MTRTARVNRKPPSMSAPRRGGVRRIHEETALPPQPFEPLTIGQLLRPLRRGWLTVALAAAVAGVAGLALAISEPPVYRATAQLEIQGFNDDFLNMKQLAATTSDQTPDTYIQTQARILESPELLERVAAKLDLKRRPEFQVAAGKSSGAQTSYGTPDQEAAAQLARKVMARTVGQTRIVEIAAESQDSKLAGDIANALAQQYIDLMVIRRLKNTNDMGQWLEPQLKELKTNLERSEQALQQYANGAGFFNLSDENPNGMAEENLRLAQEAYARARDERILEQSRYERAMSSEAETLPEVLDDPGLRANVDKLTDLRRQYAHLTTTMTPDYFRVKEIQAQIDELQHAVQAGRAGILKRIKNQYLSALNREHLEAGAYDAQKKAASSQAVKSVHYATLKHEVDTNRALYQATQQKVKEAAIVSSVRATNVQVLSAAGTPRKPARPIKSLYVAAGLMTGALLGCVVVLVRGRKRPRIQTPAIINTYGTDRDYPGVQHPRARNVIEWLRRP